MVDARASCAPCSCSSSLDDDQLAWLVERGRLVEYPAGATIHAEGAPASCFLVLLSGTLAMSKRVQGGELELFRTDYCGAYTGAFDAYVPDRGVPKVYPGTAPGRHPLPPVRDSRRRLRPGGLGVVPDGRPPAGGRRDPGRGRQRHRRAARDGWWRSAR